ncbi:MAG: molecular chaperone HtpG [Gammaproteobacteria bacterium]|nr:MAG: molecular chaperone HtpG [Gammaproteobacteria bacterium]
MSKKLEQHEFQTEAKQLLHLMIHSLYSHKEIFLRELISNASDACDKLRYEALTDNSLYEDDGDLRIRIKADKDARTLTVSDNGIGMNHDEVVENLGTIASSGTKKFVETLSGDESKDSNLIGQFGVGFYASFMVADEVTVKTRRAGDDKSKGVIWKSSGEGSFTIEQAEVEKRGTEVTLHLRESEDEYLDEWRLRTIIRKYSDNISIPIELWVEEKEEPGEDPDKTEKKEAHWEQVNEGTAIWARPKKDIKPEEYNEFYKTLSYDFEDPLAVIHNRVEGNLEYTSLLYIPAHAPFDLWDREKRNGVKLYVRRVFISDEVDGLMPAWLRFIKGVVDTNDLPLNVSREILQHNTKIDKIRAGSVKKILSELKKIAKNDPEKYQKFWDEFGKVLKEGIIEDADNRETLAELARFASTKGDGAKQTVSLDDYIERAADKQENIYYITAPNYEAAANSPHLEVFKKNDVEVLLLTDQIDEWVVQHLTEYKGKKLVSVVKGELEDALIKKESKEQKKKAKALEKDFGDILEKVKEALGDKVKDVRLSKRLTESPACLVADIHDMTQNMERLLKEAGQQTFGSKPILELNPDNPIVKSLKSAGDKLKDWAHVLLDQATLAEGGKLDEPVAFVKRINELLAGSLHGGESATEPRKPEKAPAATKKPAATKAKAKKKADKDSAEK